MHLFSQPFLRREVLYSPKMSPFPVHLLSKPDILFILGITSTSPDPEAFTNPLACCGISVASTQRKDQMYQKVVQYLEKGHMPSSSKCVVTDKEYYILLLLPFSTGHGTKPLGATELGCWGILPTIFTLQQVCLLVKL